MSKERREARRAFYEKKEKEAYRLLKRINQIGPLAHRHYMGTQMVELKEPIRRGWIRFYKVRDDIARGPEGLALEQILELVQNSARCDRKDFMKRDWSKRKNTLKPVEQKLKPLYEKQYIELPEHLKKYFTKIEDFSKWGGRKVEYRVYPEWKFKFVVKPYYITHVPITSSEAESEYAILRRKLWEHDNLAMRFMDHGSDMKDMKDSVKTKRPKEKLKVRKEAEEALTEMKEEDEEKYYVWLDS